MYYCKATNIFGTIISESVQLSFGFIGEFNLNRAAESGYQNWGKAINCDPPKYYPGNFICSIFFDALCRILNHKWRK